MRRTLHEEVGSGVRESERAGGSAIGDVREDDTDCSDGHDGTRFVPIPPEIPTVLEVWEGATAEDSYTRFLWGCERYVWENIVLTNARW
jgi:hypothetical protein